MREERERQLQGLPPSPAEDEGECECEGSDDSGIDHQHASSLAITSPQVWEGHGNFLPSQLEELSRHVDGVIISVYSLMYWFVWLLCSLASL
jgi:hypothetical protein